MRFLPSMVEGMIPSGTPLYAFGQSYGGAYVVSLSHLYLSYRENDREKIKDIWLKGIGIGNGFISPTDQSLYSEYVSNLGYVKESEFNELKKYDDEVVKSLKTSNYVRALEYSHKSLNYFVSKLASFRVVREAAKSVPLLGVRTLRLYSPRIRAWRSSEPFFYIVFRA